MELIFFDIQFCALGLSRPHFVIMKGTFNHCGRSKAWNSTHHGRYVFQTVFFLRNVNTDMYRHRYTYTHLLIPIHVHIHVRVRVCLCVFFVVWCRVMSCAACRWLGGLVWCGVVWCGVVWCGVVLSTCRCRGGPCLWSVLLRMMSILQRARAERSMIER